MKYFLLQAVRAGYRVLFETREKRFFFHDNAVESELIDDRGLRHYRGERDVFFLVDHLQDNPPPFCDAFTVAAMAPDTRTYKEFKKTPCDVLWMPLTSENELIAMNSVELHLPVPELQKHMMKFGADPSSRLHRQSEGGTSKLAPENCLV